MDRLRRAGIAGFIAIWISSSLAAQEAEPWWSIGISDDRTEELALGPDGYARFAEDAFFVVGWSDAARDWPYAHPGPVDAWGGSRAHAFVIRFAIEGVGEANSELRLDFADTHASRPPRLVVRVNGTEVADERVPPGGGDESIFGSATAGKAHAMTIAIAPELLRVGENEIEIASEEGSWVLYDAVSFHAPAGVRLVTPPSRTIVREVTAIPALVETDDGLRQPLRLEVVHFGEAQPATLTIGGTRREEIELRRGAQTLEFLADAVETATPITLELATSTASLATVTTTLTPVRKWVLYLLHHTHLDIGFTHTQDEVEKLQIAHLDRALDLIDATGDYPLDEQFRWLPEGLWAVESFLATASPEQKQRFVDAVCCNRIGLTALYANPLTGLYAGEELFALVDYAVRLREEYGFQIDSAMISDVPGCTWGVVTVLDHCGIRYLSTGPNPGHRIGHLEVWDDRPFWWIGPDGESRVLYWQAGKDGYAWFHGWRHPDNRLENKLTERRIFDYLGELEDEEYPYEHVQIRYNIGQDNGPPDPHLSESVHAWNEKFAWPKIVVATPSRMFRDFEERYGEELPEHRGDLTGYWEDGAASTAADLAANRRAGEKLLEAQTLWTLIDEESYPHERFDDAWRDTVLYDEHTWGAHNAISEPDSEFARAQAAHKQGFARRAEARSDALLADALASRRVETRRVEVVEIFNPLPWPRTELITLPAEWPLAGRTVHQWVTHPERGYGALHETRWMDLCVRSQTLASGELAFVVDDVPPYGSVYIGLEPGGGGSSRDSRIGAEGTRLFNERLDLELDPDTGAITKLISDFAIRDLAGKGGLDRYVYVAGRNPEAQREVESVRITAVDHGPVVATLRVESDAPGARELVREYRVVRGLARLDITNVLDKSAVREKESVHFSFGLDFPDPLLRIDTPWAVIRPELDQLPGACRDYFCLQRWVDVSGDDCGVTLASVDAPLLQVGVIRTDIANPFSSPQSWVEELAPSDLLYSYVMNNYWETNYAADQEGPTQFRYALQPHSRSEHDLIRAARFGLEVSRPLVVVPIDRVGFDPLLGEFGALFDSPDVLVTSLKPSRDGKARMVRLFAAAGRPVSFSFGADGKDWIRYRSSPAEERGERLVDPLLLPAGGIATLRLERAE